MSGKRISITFEVLENCCSDIIIGEDILWHNDVFNAHSSSIISTVEESEEFFLAPFAFMRKRQEKRFGKATAKGMSHGSVKNPRLTESKIISVSK